MIVRRNSDGYDHLLAAICTMLAVVAVGSGAARADMGYLQAAVIGAGSLIAHFVARRVKVVAQFHHDVPLYVLGVSAAIASAGTLNDLMPVEGYPRELWIVPTLCWMLVVGSFVAWRDTTLNFQLVPCIALFGLVTAWEERLGPGAGLFCVFLMCAAALFFRAHARTMVLQAEASGTSAVEADRSGAWRWMAGPGWALSSALVVLMLSAVVAPILQVSLRSLSGTVPINLPPASQASRAAAIFADRQNTMEVGLGPTSMIGTPVIRAMAGPGRYLRGRSYSEYARVGWRSRQFGNAQYQPMLSQNPLDFGIAPDTYEFEVQVLSGVHDQLYVPGLLVEVRAEGFEISRAREGAVIPNRPLANGARYRGIANRVSQAPTRARAAFPDGTNVRSLSGFTDAAGLPRRVIDLARQVTQGARTDWERAEAIRGFISQRAVYNLRAARVPRDQDAVDSFLFETREGYCDLFATSMVMMARSVGLPSRLATGFLLDPSQRDSEGWSIARDSDYHAWAEVYFDGIGWIPFDATEGAVQAPGGERSRTYSAEKPWWEAAWVQVALDVVLALGVAGIIVAGLYGLAPKGSSWRTVMALVRGWIIPPKGRAEVERLFGVYQRDLRRRTRRPRRLGQTPREYVARFEAELGDAARPARELNAAFEAALFGPGEVASDETGRLSKMVRRFRAIPAVRR